MSNRAWASRPTRTVGLALAMLLLSALVPTSAEAATAGVVYHGSRLKPYIALTIDDGYNSANCLRIADILRVMHVPATYFPYAQVFSSRSTWRSIAARYPVANHSYSHPFMTRLSYTGQLWQIRAAQQRFKAVTGRTMVPVFRPPYGAYNLNTRRAAAAAGIRYLVLWDTSFGDTSAASDAAHFRAAMRGTRGSIILLHCGPSTSVRILPRVIRAYRARGLTFVTVQQLLGMPAPSPTPAPIPVPTRPPAQSPEPSDAAPPTEAPVPTDSPTLAPPSPPAETPAPSEPTGAGDPPDTAVMDPGTNPAAGNLMPDRGPRRLPGHDPPLA